MKCTPVIDPTLGQVHELMNRLQECLIEGAEIRARLTKLREEGKRPDVEGAMARLVAEHQGPRRH